MEGPLHVDRLRSWGGSMTRRWWDVGLPNECGWKSPLCREAVSVASRRLGCANVLHRRS